MHPDTEKLLRDPSSELVFGLVAPVGADLDVFESLLSDQLKLFRYQPKTVRLSNFLSEAKGPGVELGIELKDAPEVDRIRTYMDAGNRLRQLTRNEILALWSIATIFGDRPKDAPQRPRTAYIVRSIKHPDEARALRAVYGPGFFLVGLSASEFQKLAYLDRKGVKKDEAMALIARDQGEENDFGQQTRDAFELADVFIRQEADSEATGKQIERFLKLVFGTVNETPTAEEHAMFLAYASSLRSGDLSRQVGAVVWRDGVGILGTGCNDVPRAGGGQYWPGDDDQRDHRKGEDANQRHKNLIVDEVTKHVASALGLADAASLAKIREACGLTRLLDITEFGRAMHAEMDALLSAARAGVSTQDCTIFSTTFPCHNCAKHILAAGIRRVVYIEPYEKSQAVDLHGDALMVRDHANPKQDKRIVFEPFVGVGPRRYFDLFSMRLSNGYQLRRKKDGKLAPWEKESAVARVPLLTTSYLEREKLLAETLTSSLEKRP